MKKGICIGSLPGGLSLEEKLRLAKDAGLDGVELGTIEDVAEARSIRELVDRIGIRVPSIMASKHWSHPLSSPDPAARQVCAQNIRDSISCAKILGADTVLLVPGVVSEEVSYEEAYGRSQPEVRALAKYAEDAQVYIGIENVWNKFLLSPVEFARYVDEIDSPYVQAYFDCGNILLYGYPQQWIRTLGTRIKKVHVKGFKISDRTFVYLLEGDINWAEVRQALVEVGYDDYITAEMPVYPVCPEQMVYDTSAHLGAIIEGRC